MPFIRLLHVYAGLVLSLLLFVLAVTGAALIYKEAWWQLAYDELDGPDVLPTAAQQADAIAAAHARFGSELVSIKMPEPGVPAYHLYLQEGEAFLSLDGGRIDQWAPHDRLMSWLFDLHAHLMAGETGELVGGAVSLAGALMALTGLVLWFPTRRLFAPGNLWPRRLSRRYLLSWHRDMGMLLSPLLLLLLLSGSGLVFYAQAQRLFNGLFGDAVPVSVPPDTGRGPVMGLPDSAALERVNQYFPDSRLVFFYFEESAGGWHRYRLKQACELHPNGRSYIYTDARSGKVLQAEDACALPPGERIVHAIYPLHAAKTGSGLYKLLAFLGSLVLAGLALTGVITYGQKLFRGRGQAS